MTHARTRHAFLPVLFTTTALAAPLHAQPQGDVGRYSDVTIEGAVLEPEPMTVEDDGELAARISVPDGFKVAVVGRDMGNARMLAVHDSGHVYATRRTEGDVIRLVYEDGDGRFESFQTVASRPGMHGIAFNGDTAFLVTANDVYTAPVNADGSLGDLTRIIDDLPDGGQHPNRTLAMGPDGKLYISVGSTCNACGETNPENATLLRAEPDGSSRTIFASGLRNTIGFGWHPETGDLYGADHGIDWLGNEEQIEELNLITQGNKYGWPYVYGMSEHNPQDNPPEGVTLEDWAAQSEEPVLGYTPHAAPMQMVFYTGSAFPEEFRGDAFIAMRGSWNRRPPSGYEITRVDFQDGQPGSWDTFADGFLVDQEEGPGFLSRPTGLTQDQDGSLLFSDDVNGIIYRISHAGETEAAGETTSAPPDTVPAPIQDELAIDKFDAEASVSISSAAFDSGASIPIDYAGEGHNASPPLSWEGAPDKARSFVLLIEDPDAAEPTPFVHWVVYDIPADTTSLGVGQPTSPVLPAVEGAKQGANSRGQIGYFGPRPPLEEPVHSYHFQVFALDVEELGLEPGASRSEVVDAMDGHVIAQGEVVGTYQRPTPEKPQH